MTYVTLWSPGATGAAATGGAPAGPAAPGADADPSPAPPPLLAPLLALSPHVAAGGWDGGTLVWVDGRGLPARVLARGVLRAAEAGGVAGARVGVARVPVAAAVAARWGVRRGEAPPEARPCARACTAVAAGAEAAFLAAHPLGVLLGDADPPAWRRAVVALADAGVPTCGALAALTLASVEVRFGAAGVALWRLAHADDVRAVFRHAVRERPSASVAWTEYEVREPGPLVFAVAGLVEQVCAALRARGEAARALALTFALAGGGAVVRRVRGARDTADPAAWRRLVRAELERVGAEDGGLPDGVVGLALAVEAARAARAPQADLFDRGAASAGAAERAAARLVEDGLGQVVRPRAGAHALPERGVTLEPVEVDAALRAMALPAAPRVLPPGGPAPDRSSAATLGAPPGAAPTPRPRLALVQPGARSARLPSGPPAAGAPGRGTSPGEAPASGAPASEASAPGAPLADALRLRLLATPRALAMITRPARGHRVPVRYRERLPEGARLEGVRPPHGRGLPLVEVVTVGGPDRVVTGYDAGGAPEARDYWHCLTDAGRLVLLYRAHAPTAPPAPSPGEPAGAAPAPAGSAVAGPPLAATAVDADEGWYLHGWWD